jgi:hypothetical protein
VLVLLNLLEGTPASFRGAGTDASVFIEMIGDQAAAGEQRLESERLGLWVFLHRVVYWFGGLIFLAGKFQLFVCGFAKTVHCCSLFWLCQWFAAAANNFERGKQDVFKVRFLEQAAVAFSQVCCAKILCRSACNSIARIPGHRLSLVMSES